MSACKAHESVAKSDLCPICLIFERNKLRTEYGYLQAKVKQLREDEERLDWLDLHTSFVADGEYLIGPYKIGELRKMADDGIAIDKNKQTLKEK